MLRRQIPGKPIESPTAGKVDGRITSQAILNSGVRVHHKAVIYAHRENGKITQPNGENIRINTEAEGIGYVVRIVETVLRERQVGVDDALPRLCTGPDAKQSLDQLHITSGIEKMYNPVALGTLYEKAQLRCVTNVGRRPASPPRHIYPQSGTQHGILLSILCSLQKHVT